jgi:hypothetical protein
MIKSKIQQVNNLLNHKLSPRFLQFLLIISISILCGLAWFLLLYGRYPLYLTNVNWIYKTGGDIFQHQIGWEWFRQEPWRFPLGRIDAYGYPFGTSLIFTDSIPLFAIPLKLFSPLMEQNFQYLGIWGLASVIGQMLMGMLILGEFTSSYFNKILGASLLVLSPPLILRFFFHDSLTAQWILLAAIWFILLEYRHKLWRSAWIVLLAIATLIHPYFVAMLMPLWAISLFFRFTREKNMRGLILDVLGGFGVILLIGFCIGLISLDAGNNVAEVFFGNYSWNLNGFINPGKYSSILKQMPTGTDRQYEGFSYLGLGNLLLLPIALILYLQKDYSPRHQHLVLPFVLVSIMFSLFALSNQAFINTQSLWVIERPEFIPILFSIFRACGRFIWPVFYFLVLFGLISIVRNLRYAMPLLFLALVLQLIDIQPLYSLKKYNGFVAYKSDLQAEFWQAASKTNQHILFIPPENLNPIYEPVALYARQNNLTLNWGYFARGNYGAIKTYGNQVWEDLKDNRANKQTIYIFYGSEWIGLAKEYLSSHMLICKVDGYNIALSVDNQLIQSNFDLTPYCSFP